MENKYKFEGSPFPWKLSQAILNVYSDTGINREHGAGHEICKVTRGDWGDEYPVIKQIGSSLENHYRAEMEMLSYGHTPEDIAKKNALMIIAVGDLFKACVNFIGRVESGESGYVRESYEEMTLAVGKALGISKTEEL